METILAGIVGVSTMVLAGVVVCAYVLARKPDESWRDPMPRGARIPLAVMRPLIPVLPLGAEGRRTATEKLSHAGLSYTLLPEELVACRWFGGIAGALFFAVIAPVLPFGAGPIGLSGVICTALGYKYPDIVLRDIIRRRHHSIQKDFPFFLDLLLLCLRVGLSFTAALEQAVAKMGTGPLRSELERTMRDVRTGMSRRDALVHVGERTGLTSVSNFVGAVNQAEESGAPLVDALAAQASQRLDERFQRAEELANKAPVKMMLPLTLFLFPVTMIIVFFPIVVKFLQSGGGSLFG